MKKFLFGVLSVLALVSSCTRPDSPVAGTTRNLTFRAYSDNGTVARTTLDTDGLSVLWKHGDAISVFDKSSSTNNRFTNTAAAGHVAVFSGMAPADQYYFAVSPYQADAVLEDAGETVIATLPPAQTATPDSFGEGAGLAVAATAAGGDLHFRNVGGLLGFSFTSSHKIVSVRISSSGSPMSGRIAMMADDNAAPSVEAYVEALNYVELSGTFVSGSSYYAVALPGSFSGLRVQFKDEDGATASFSNPVQLDLERNEKLWIGSFLIPEGKWVSPPAEEYVKVDSDQDDWSGTYLVVSGNYAADGVVSNNWLGHKPVTVSGGKIARDATTREYEVTVARVSGTQYYSLKFVNGNYLGTTNANNGIKTGISASGADFQWQLSYDIGTSSVRIAISTNPERILRLNLQNTPGGFRTYTGATGTQAILYRYEASVPPEETGITSSGVLGRNTTSAQLTASFFSLTHAPSRGGFKYGTTESLGSTAFSADITGTSGTFSSELMGLTEGTLYYYQAFIIVDGVTYVGTMKSFRTASDSPGSGGRGWFELPAQKDVDHNGIDDENPDYYYSWTMRADAPAIRNFSSCYSKSRIHPVWVAAPMHTSYLGPVKRKDAYARDPAITCEQSASFPGFTRGHMIGSSDRTVTRPTNQQVFYYSNIGAQLQDGFNTGGGAWNKLEDHVDEFLCADTLYQVVGCIFETFTTKPDGQGRTTTISKRTGTNGAGHAVQIPTAWYKVLLRTKDGNTGKAVNECTSDDLQCVAFILPHQSHAGHAPAWYDMYSVQELEELTGLTFFVNVPDAPKLSFSYSDWGISKDD